MIEVPKLYTSRYFAEDVLSSGEVVPVGISFQPPPFRPAYEIEHSVPELMPEPIMFGEWPQFSTGYLVKLGCLGMHKIGEELAAISRQHGDKPLALLCHEDLQRGLQCHRVLFAAWWKQQTSRKVLELTNDGEMLELPELHP